MMELQLFVTCLVDSFFPDVGLSVVELLESTGCRVVFPEGQTCCGQPTFNAGFWEEARPLAMRTITVLTDLQDPIVVPSGSCAAMIRHGYLELFQDEPEWLLRAKDLAARTYELSEFLLEFAYIPTPRTSEHKRVAYHPSCHLHRGIDVSDQPLRLLSIIEDLEVVTLPEECCGFGGLFAVDHALISEQMVKRRIEAIDAADVEGVVACDVSCLMQIEGAMRKQGSALRCSHLAQMLTGRKLGLR